VVTWLIARAFNQRGLLQTLEPAGAPPADRAPEVAVIVPARDEAANIGRCLQSLVDQSYPPLRIVVVDDHSTDATLAIATFFAERHPQLGVLRSPPLPPRWVGKAHACWIGAQAVGPDAPWLCFIDADVWGEPDLMASAVAAVTAERLDLLSLAPRQQLQSFAERLTMPCGLYLLAFYQDLHVVQARDGPEATATGQFILVRRSFYDAIGGHAAVHGAISEDLMLARLLKRAGGHALLQDGRRLLSTRMYTGWSSLWIGVSKNLTDMLGGPSRTIAVALAAVVLAWAALLIPLADTVSCARDNQTACGALAPAVLGSAAAFGLHIAGASYFRIPLWYGLLFPLGYSVGAAMAIDSVRRRLSGHVSWKGRTYP
ncbi:MAG: glycosyltransferase family A protein, partial [Xanthobacteraceae bacterium]